MTLINSFSQFKFHIMNDLIVLASAFIFFISLMAFGFRSIYKSAKSLHNKLDILRVQSLEVENKEDLLILWEDWQKLNKECWHKSFLPKLYEIKGIIETRYPLLP
jgi:hypothetical protein